MISVRRNGQLWDVEVSRDRRPPLTPVWLVRGTGMQRQANLLCQVQKNDRFGWDVVVAGDVRGLRLVEGFKARWQAIQYAISVRNDINKEGSI